MCTNGNLGVRVRTRNLAYEYERECRMCTNENLVCLGTRILACVYEREFCRMCTNGNIVVCIRTRILSYVYERESCRMCTNENLGVRVRTRILAQLYERECWREQEQLRWYIQKPNSHELSTFCNSPLNSRMLSSIISSIYGKAWRLSFQELLNKGKTVAIHQLYK